jgi:hypothetical protein
MLGTFQQSQLRIAIEAKEEILRESLLDTQKLRQWLFPQWLSDPLPQRLEKGTVFTSWTLGIPITHRVEEVTENSIRLLLSQGIDGYHEWYWGEGWVQSRLEGVSLLPLNLGQTLGLLRLRWFVTNQEEGVP